MESTTDFDLQELESRLYSQVFHSTENWDTPTENSNLNNFQTRHVSLYTVSNMTVKGNRYWDAKNAKNSMNSTRDITDTFQNNDKTIPNGNTLHQQDQSKTTNIVPNPFHDTNQKENSEQLDSIIPLENTIAEEYRTKPLKFKSFFVPTTLRLPRSRARKFPQYIIEYFRLNSKDSKRRFRSFLRHVEKTNNNSKSDAEHNESGSQDITLPPAKITITTNGVEKNIKLSDIPTPVNDTELIPLKIENLNISDNNTQIITLSDSDSDSVIEVPLPPIPVYNVCSSDSEAEELDTSNNLTTKGNEVEYISESEDITQENLVQENIDKNNFGENNHNDEIQITEQEQLPNTNQNNSKKTNKDNCVDMNVSFTQLEKERDEFLFTPDSNTNDFLEHDVSNLSKNNLSFNFGLHASDLDLTKDKEESISKSGPPANDQDLYETESSCSEMGSIISKSRPVFNEINFESPIKDIFCEPDLSKFSNFITPNRIKSTSKVRSNTIFTHVKTNACNEKISNNEKNRVLTRSDSSEYHSDPTTLKVKKKNKKAKKKSKKKGKQPENIDLNSELCLLLSEDAQVTETNVDKMTTSSIPLEETNENTKSFLSSKQIENLKFGPSTSAFNDTQNNSVKISIFNSSTKEKPCASPIDYYVDTYFADDCLLLEELEQKNKKPEKSKNNIEASNSKENTMKELVSVNIETTQILPSDVTVKINDNKNLNFSFIDTWRKSTDKNCNKDEKKTTNEPENEVSPNKKLKADHSPTVHPYVVTVISSDEESNASETIRSDDKINSRSVNVDDNCPDLIVINVKNDFASKSTSKNNFVANPFSFVNTYLQNQEKKSFKDYWTNDMTKFYDESWGQENFDMDRIQSSMSRNTSDWKIIPDDIYTISRRRRGPLCLRCREYGHTQYNCSRNGPIKCSTCGIEGHSYSRCPNSICTTCRNPTNHYTTSCRSCSHFRTILCSLCNNVGHEVKYCPDLWRRYHLTTESHTELQSSSSVLKAPSERWCANCAKKGHCDDKCTDLRHEHFPTTPRIISYVPTYDDVFKLPVTPSSPNIPLFQNANVTIDDLRTIKKNVVQDSNKKYMNILKQLRQQCNKYDTQLIDQIDRLRRNMNNQEFTRKKIQEIYKIRARVEKYKIS